LGEKFVGAGGRGIGLKEMSQGGNGGPLFWEQFESGDHSKRRDVSGFINWKNKAEISSVVKIRWRPRHEECSLSTRWRMVG